MPLTSPELTRRWLDPKFKFFVNRKEDRISFMMKDDNLKGEYLGACLDYVRWGGETTVMYELGTRGLIGFILEWKKLNKENLIWHSEPLPKDFDLPRIKKDSCGTPEHALKFEDMGGRTRCAHQNCYSIISDAKATLSLEEVLNRLNLSVDREYCPSSHLEIGFPCKRLDELDEREKKYYESVGFCLGHPAKQTIHPFDGWNLAWYVQKWHEQIPYGKPSIFGRSQ